MTPDQLDAILNRYAAAYPADFGDGDPHAAAEAADDAVRHTSGTTQYEPVYESVEPIEAGWADQTEDMAEELGQSLPDDIALMASLVGDAVDQRQIVDLVATQARLNAQAAAFNARHAGDGMQAILNRQRYAGNVESAQRNGTGAELD